MVKAGKFGHRAIQFATNPLFQDRILQNPIKKVWWGTVTKLTLTAASQNLNVRGPTWGFVWIDYAEVYSRSFNGTSAGGSLGAPSVMYYRNISPTIVLGATLGIETKQVLIRLWGR